MALVAFGLMVVIGLSVLGIGLLVLWVGFKVVVGLVKLVWNILAGIVVGIADAIRAVVLAVWSGLRRVVLGKRATKMLMYACPRPACGEFNPREACFCRRCGRRMEAVTVEQRGGTTWVSPVGVSSVGGASGAVPPPVPGVSGSQVVLSSWRR